MNQPGIIHNHGGPEYFFQEGCHIMEWWNSPDDESVSVARVRVIPGVTTRRHRLRGVTERYVILKGKGLVEVGGLIREAVGPGDVVVIPPEVMQRIANPEKTNLIFLAVCTPRFTEACYEDMDSGSGSESYKTPSSVSPSRKSATAKPHNIRPRKRNI